MSLKSFLDLAGRWADNHRMTRNEHLNRQAIAEQLAAVLRSHGAAPDDVFALPDVGWSMVAGLINREGYVPSKATKAAVYALLTRRDIPQPSDPFQGLGQ